MYAIRSYYALKGEDIEPMITWGINPGQAVGIKESLPAPKDLPEDQQDRRADDPDTAADGRPRSAARASTARAARVPARRRDPR